MYIIKAGDLYLGVEDGRIVVTDKQSEASRFDDFSLLSQFTTLRRVKLTPKRVPEYDNDDSMRIG